MTLRTLLLPLLVCGTALLAACADDGSASKPPTSEDDITSAAELCQVVEVTALNNEMFEEGLGSIYDVDDDGNPMADEDSVTASVDPRPKGLEVRIGQMRFTPEGGDTVVETPATAEQPFKVVTVTRKDQILELRIFKVSKLGVVLVKKSQGARPGRLATLDCRRATKTPIRE